MSVRPFSLSKEERLCSRKIIETIFENGKTFNSHPFRFLWVCNASELSFPVQVAFVVSKRNFRQAVKRNLIKRRIREAYRKNKSTLYTALSKKNSNCSLIIIYYHNEILNSSEIEILLIKAFQKFLPAIEKGIDSHTDQSD